jgi:hypothetical protein
MTTNLTGNKINETFDQLLHVSDGPTATEKTVYSGSGVATVLKLGTQSMSGTFSEIEFDDPEQARTALELEGMALQSPSSVEITGGTIDDVVITNATFGGLAMVEAGKFTTATDIVGDGVAVETNEIYAEGTSTNIDIDIIPKGTGEVNITNIDVLSGKVPFNTITNRAYGIFYDLSDQTFLANTATVVEFDTTGLSVGVTVASSTRITFAAAGTYEIACRLQFINAENTDHSVAVWFRLNGTDIPYSASELVVPKSSDGGTACHAITGILQATAGQYLEVVVATEDADVSLHHVAPLTTPYVRPDIPSVILVANRIA